MKRFVLSLIALISLCFAYAAENIDIVFIGNSITYGAELSSPSTQAPPVRVREILSGQIENSVTIRNCGHSGSTTLNWLPGTSFMGEALNAAASLQADGGTLFFSLMLGTNDSAESGPTGAPVSPANYKTNVINIINNLLSNYPDARIIINYPIWYSPNTHNGAVYLQAGLNRLQSYHPVLTEIVTEMQAAGKKVYAGKTEAYNYFENNTAMLTAENGNSGIFYLHPNSAGAKKLAGFWAESILENATDIVEPIQIDTKSYIKGDKIITNASQFSTNCEPLGQFSLANLIDGNLTNIYHSWTGGARPELCWIQVDLGEALDKIYMHYDPHKQRAWALCENDNPSKMTVFGSNDNSTWTQLLVMDGGKMGMPTAIDESYDSPVIKLGNAYRYVRFRIDETLGNRMDGNSKIVTLAEFQLYKVIENENEGLAKLYQYVNSLNRNDYTTAKYEASSSAAFLSLYDAAVQAVSDGNKSSEEYETILNGLKEAEENLNIITIPDGFYYIASSYPVYEQNYGVKKGMYSYANQYVAWHNLDKTSPYYLWKVERIGKEDGNMLYKVQNVATGLYMANLLGKYASTTAMGAAQVIARESDGKYWFYPQSMSEESGRDYHCENHAAGAGMGGLIMTYSNPNVSNDYFTWQFIAPTEAELNSLQAKLAKYKSDAELADGYECGEDALISNASQISCNIPASASSIGNLIDNNINTTFQTQDYSKGTPALEISLGKPVSKVYLSMKARNDGNYGNRPMKINVYGSNDNGTTWTPATTIEDIELACPYFGDFNKSKEFEKIFVNLGAEYQNIKLEVERINTNWTNSLSVSDNFFCLSELQLYEGDVKKDAQTLAALINEAKTALPTYKTSIQDGDYYAGTDANHGLRSHYFVNGTEKTSQKGYECTQGQIDALAEAIIAAESIDANASKAEIVAAYDALAEAKAVCDKKWDPLTDGIYFIINGFADDAPDAAQALKYGENGDLLYKRPLVNLEPKQMFEVKVLSWDTDADGDKIPTSAYIKNVASGKYLGGVVNGHNTFSDEPVVISWPVANTQGTTKQAHRFQLQTPTGELFNGVGNKAGCEILTSGAYQWQRSWMFRPADEYYAEYLANKEAMDYQNTVTAALNTPTATQDGDLGSNTWIDGTERTAVAGFETTKERIDALQAAWDTYNADKTAENKAAVDAAMELVNKKWEPLTDGVYFLIPRYGDDQINKNTLALTTEDDAAYKRPLTKTSPSFMFEVKVVSTTEDPELGTVPQTLTIKNVYTGKYLGAVNGNAWGYQDDEVVWSYTTFVGSDFFSDTKHAHCFGLNIDGKFMTYETNTTGTPITTTTGGFAWKRAWMFRPAEKYYEEYLADKDAAEKEAILGPALTAINTALTPANHHDNTGTRSFLLGNEKTSIDGIATSKEAVDALREAYNNLKEALDAGKKVSECQDLVTALNDAKAVVDAKSNPLTNGYYYLIGEYGDDTNTTPGGFAIQYGAYASNAMSAVKKPYDAGNIAQMFKVELAEGGKVYLQNVASGLYLGAVGSDNRWQFVEEKTALNIVTGENYYWYHNATKAAAARSCSFVLTDDNARGISSSTAQGSRLNVVTDVKTSSSAWVISWAFRPVAEELLPEVTVENGIATVNYNKAFTEPLYSVVKEAVKDKTINSVDLTNVNVSALTPAQVTIEGISANAIYYMPDNYPTPATNFVINNVCSSLVLTDKIDFVPAKDFTATAVSYSRNIIDEGWNTLVLPFAFNVPEGMTALHYGEIDGDKIYFEQFEVEEDVYTGLPLVYKAPKGLLTITGENATIKSQYEDYELEDEQGNLHGTFTNIPVGEATGKYIMNSAGTAFAEATTLASIPAFRAYMNNTTASKLFTIILKDDITGINNGTSDTNAKVDVYTTDGRLVRKGVSAVNALQGLESGIYVINGKTTKK